MNCSEVRELLSAYHDFELDDCQTQLITDHLAGCGGCADELAQFRSITRLAAVSEVPVAGERNWNQIERGLESKGSVSVAFSQEKQFARPAIPFRNLVLAVAAAIVVGIGWLSYISIMHRRQHAQFAAEFSEYLQAFQHDADAAQDLLLAKYEHERVDPTQKLAQVGYRPAVSKGLPEGYQLESTHVMTMPCCTCVQTLCRRRDGTSLAIFEHDDEDTDEWFGDRPASMAQCADRECSLVALESHIAATWQRGSRHITLIGVRDTDEVSRIIAWLDGRDESVAN